MKSEVESLVERNDIDPAYSGPVTSYLFDKVDENKEIAFKNLEEEVDRLND